MDVLLLMLHMQSIETLCVCVCIYTMCACVCVCVCVHAHAHALDSGHIVLDNYLATGSLQT